MLREDPHSFSFFQAVRLLEQLHPEKSPVGEFARPQQEVVRFGVNPSLGFPAGQIQELTIEGAGPAQMEVNFMGLVGTESVLPFQYSLAAQAERERRARPLTDFLNMFQHRMVSLMYRAWARARFYVSFERDLDDRVSRHVRDLIGLGHSTLRNRIGVRDVAVLYHAGLLAMRNRGAIGLEQLLSDYFEVPVEVRQFVGAWYRVSTSFQCTIDDDAFDQPTIGLGGGAVLGDEVWDAQGRVRLRIGPLTRPQYNEFLPGGAAHAALKSLTRFYSDGDLDFEVQLILARDDVPGVVLGGEKETENVPLGWCTWVKTHGFSHDADETTLML